MKLWPKALVRPIRLHDLRHTTASLLLMAGANPAAVQRILRHSDPRLTTEVYGRLVPDYLRSEIDRLSFGISAPDPASKDPPCLGASPRSLATSVVLAPARNRPGSEKNASTEAKDSEDFDLWARRDSNPRPPASEGISGNPQMFAGISKYPESRELSRMTVSTALQQEAPFRRSFGPPVVQENRLLTVREVAAILRVCTATVYRLCSRGSLAHLRVSNSVRIPMAAASRYSRRTCRATRS
jgi:excisionase family DNA binding protein